jgi:hypothetical protein
MPKNIRANDIDYSPIFYNNLTDTDTFHNNSQIFNFSMNNPNHSTIMDKND